MRIEILGSGGAVTTPQPGCTCRVCREARERGVPYSRSGPSTFVHGPDVLFDTPEEIKDQLNRSRVDRIRACFYSHWHPDHVMGRRVWEMNRDWRSWPPRGRSTDIFLPNRVAQDFRSTLGTWQHLAYLEEHELVRLTELDEGESVMLADYRVTPIPLAERYVYAFLIEGEGKRVLIAPDELVGWEPPPMVRGVDVAVMPMGVVEFDPFSGERCISQEHPVLTSEATFAWTLETARRLETPRVVLTHIEEPDQLSHGDLKRLQPTLCRNGMEVVFAFDTMVIDV